MDIAQKILKLIEKVNPNDMQKLAVIDAKIWCWLNNGELQYNYDANPEELIFWENKSKRWLDLVQYTKSRDALKAIRPEGWYFQILPNGDGEYRCDRFNRGGHKITKGSYRPTEELAELHAIIQAIEYERKNV